MRKANGVNYSMRAPVISRRLRVIDQREAQLKSGVKNTKNGPVPLSEKDTKRIQKEIKTLKARV